MKFEDIDFSTLQEHFISGGRFVDVRAPVEFCEGTLPGAANLFLLDDVERARIGTCYKFSGREAAIQLGHKIVSGENREKKIALWREHFEKNSDSIVFCARGGLRSKISAEWIAELEIPGLKLRRLAGGFKEARRQILEYFDRFAREYPLLILSGMTGSAKTHALNSVKAVRPAIDLEGLAHHRGSAFGSWEIPQPRQVDFENRIYTELLKIEKNFSRGNDSISTPSPSPSSVVASSSRGPMELVVEDESRMIGLCVIPEKFFQKMRVSPVVLIEEPLPTRVLNIYKDYISSTAIGRLEMESAKSTYANYKRSLKAIERKLGGARLQEILLDLQMAENEFFLKQELELNFVWIEKLLKYYYDPMYSGSLSQRNPKIVFRGSRADVEDYLRNFIP